MRIKFTKMHGAGNDYIYVNTMYQPIAHPSEAAIRWSDRRKGIGSDGLVLIDRSPIPEADFAMRIFNADGSEAKMCGNASRCIGKYVYERGLTDKTEIRLLTLSGIKTLTLHLDRQKQVVQQVTVDMGEPLTEDATQFDPTLPTGQEGVFVSMGNPHYVIFTDNVDLVGETGKAMERHPAFPQRCNIEFASVMAPNNPAGAIDTMDAMPGGDLPPQPPQSIRTRVWERGSGITMACGTGACATAVAAALTRRAGRHTNIVMDGGTLTIEWRTTDNHVLMTGPAELVFDGEIDTDLALNDE